MWKKYVDNLSVLRINLGWLTDVESSKSHFKSEKSNMRIPIKIKIKNLAKFPKNWGWFPQERLLRSQQSIHPEPRFYIPSVSQIYPEKKSLNDVESHYIHISIFNPYQNPEFYTILVANINHLLVISSWVSPLLLHFLWSNPHFLVKNCQNITEKISLFRWCLDVTILDGK